MQHQFNLGSAVQPPPFIPARDPDAPMYASVEGTAIPLSDEEVVFQTRDRDEAQVLTTQVLTVMDHCRAFRSLDEHVAEIIRKVSGLSRPEAVRRGLEVLIRSGLLVSDADFLAHSRSHARVPAPLGGICIRTCDRPESLGRLLRSLEANEARHGLRHPVLVIDDSRDTANARANADLVRASGQATGAPMRYIGAREQEALVRQLHKAFPVHASAIDALLVHRDASFGGGRPWNLALLLTAGRRLFLLDEDFELPLRTREDVTPGLALVSRGRAPAWFHADRDAALAAGTEVDDDPFRLHLDLVGNPLGAVTAAGPWAITREALRGMELHALRGLHDGHRVLASINGTRGSTRMGEGEWLFLLDPASRARLCADRDAYLRNLRAENVWDAPIGAEVVEQCFITPFALDNSELLPCTNAAGRNEDALFNTLARFCHPESLAMSLPWTLGHVQERDRGEAKARGAREPGNPGLNSFAYETLLNHAGQCMSADPAERMRFAAAIFEDIATASESRRLAHLRGYINFFRGDLIARLQQQLMSAPDAPVFWQADVRDVIGANARAMVATSPPRLAGWPADLDAAGCAARLGSSLASLAAELRAWPDLWAWAAEQGEHLIPSA